MIEITAKGRHTMIHATPRPSGPSVSVMTASCLGRTCLKWQENGELTDLDLRLVLERLAQVDQDVTALLDRSVDNLPCPSIS